LKLQWPWAKREETRREIHGLRLDLALKATTCAGCGHQVLARYSLNRRVEVKRRAPDGELVLSSFEVYGRGCDPGYDLREEQRGGGWRYFKRSEDPLQKEMIEVLDERC